MPRAHISKVLQNPDGSVMTGASVRVLADGATTNIADALYTTDAGSSTLTNPFTSTDGRVEFYLDNPQRIQIGITPVGGTESFITADAMPDALYTVVSEEAHLSLGTPVPGRYMRINTSGQVEYVTVAGTSQRLVTAVSADYASTSDIGEVMVVTGTRAITLPTPSSANQGCVYTIKNAGTGTVTVHATSGTIDGASTFSLTVQYSSIDVVNDGTNWFTV